MTKNIKKLQLKQNRKFNNFLIANRNFLIPRPRTSKLLEKRSALKREHPALQNMKFLNFFIILWVISDLLDPDLTSIRIQDGDITVNRSREKNLNRP
jgi:hypothetical protein